MFSQTWRRPVEAKFPEVWRKFQKTARDGKVLKFKIQTATEEYYDDILDMMNKYFLTEETLNRTAGCGSSPEYVKLINELVRSIIFPHNTSLVCILDGDENPNGNSENQSKKPQLVGYNLCGACNENEAIDLTEIMKIEAGAKLLSIWMELKKCFPNTHEKYGVKCYMGSLGLTILPEFRGMNISQEILMSRISICKAVGIKVTSSLFTATASQIAATRAGYVEDGSLDFSELGEMLGIHFLTDTKYCKVSTYANVDKKNNGL